MTPAASQADRKRARALLANAMRRHDAPFDAVPDRVVMVDVGEQLLYLVEHGEAIACYPISTAAAGIGGEKDSGRTPPGWMRIHARIGEGQPEGARFESREPTGEVWRGERRDDDLILTRVLTLDGLEDGVNRGPGVDTLARYIYIHGTNHEGALGRPVSHGCVRMANSDVCDLFERVREGDAVIVTGEALHA